VRSCLGSFFAKRVHISRAPEVDAHWSVMFGKVDENGAFPTVCSLAYFAYNFIHYSGLPGMQIRFLHPVDDAVLIIVNFGVGSPLLFPSSDTKNRRKRNGAAMWIKLDRPLLTPSPLLTPFPNSWGVTQMSSSREHYLIRVRPSDTTGDVVRDQLTFSPEYFWSSALSMMRAITPVRYIKHPSSACEAIHSCSPKIMATSQK